jgi:hypothetical protein
LIVDKKLLINVILTFSYFLVAGVAALKVDNVTASVAIAVAAAAARSTIGLYAKKRGAALPPDA